MMPYLTITPLQEGSFTMTGSSHLAGIPVDVTYAVHYQEMRTIRGHFDHYEVIISINGFPAFVFTQEALKEANNNISDDIYSEIYERVE